MSYDFSPDWTVTVRGAPSMQTKNDPRRDVNLQAWLPKEEVPSSPPLMGMRQVGEGRLAVLPFRTEWIFFSNPNCPPVETMLKHDGDKPSDWLIVLANTFRWLSEPGRKAGWPGTETSEELLNPPVKVWNIPPRQDWWKEMKQFKGLEGQVNTGNTPQNSGLVGARTALSGGSGTVADYV